MKINLIRSGPALLLIMASSTVWGQSGIYRCGNSYSQTPCIGGQEIAVDQRRPPGAKIDSDRTNDRISHEADAMEKARLQREDGFQKQLNLVAARKNKADAPVTATPPDTQSDTKVVKHKQSTKKKPATPKPFTAQAAAPAKPPTKAPTTSAN